MTSKRLNVLRLFNSPGPTSAPFNQFSIGLQSDVNQVLLSLFPPLDKTNNNLDIKHASGSFLSLVRLIKKTITNFNFDVIHVHSGHTGLALLFAILPTCIELRKYVVFTLHTSFHLLSARNKILVFFTMLLSNTICPCSKSSEKSLPLFIRLLFKNKIKVVLNGFDSCRLDRAKVTSNLQTDYNQNGSTKILAVGALNKNKNQISILKALKGINKLCEVVFLGDGPERKYLEEISKTICNKNLKISFKGRVSRNLAMRYMLEADVFISASNGEGMPISVLEALYSKCQIVLSDIPPHQEILEIVKAPHVVNFERTDDAAKLIRKVSFDSLLSHGLSNEIKENVKKNFGLRVMLDKYLDLYNEVVRNSKIAKPTMGA